MDSITETHTHTTRLGQLHVVVARPDRNSTLAQRGRFVRSFVRWNGKHRHRQDAFATGIPGFHTYLRPTDFKSQNPAWEYICQALCTVCTVRTQTQRARAGERARRRETNRRACPKNVYCICLCMDGPKWRSIVLFCTTTTTTRRRYCRVCTHGKCLSVGLLPNTSQKGEKKQKKPSSLNDAVAVCALCKNALAASHIHTCLLKHTCRCLLLPND
ncbi:hypothetical protein IWZ03DRAFT_16250 [Phyllosticta citriasiana]|uniref:Uncharacterized protein n=2 Tax=Phyllosticta citriasiana TaxID=595635 RepID=A0ABR1KYT1_9PEZI